MRIHYMQNLSSRRRRGFTLTEIAIVLGIVGLILGAIWVAAAAVYNNLRVSHTDTSILQTAQAVRTLYATQSSITAGNQTSSMITAGVTATDEVNTAGTGLTNAWGGSNFVGGTTDGLGIVIELTKVPENSCINVVAQVAGNTRDSGLFQAGATADTGAYVAVAAIATPLAAAKAPTAASTGCVAGLNQITFGFLLKG